MSIVIGIENTIDGNFVGAFSVEATDVDCDGDVDVLGASVYDNDIAWWENIYGQGTTWIEHTIDPAFDGAASVYYADVDGDGDIDVLGAAMHADEFTWWENINGLGTTWIEHTIAEYFNVACSVYSDDIDGDGDIDVLGAGGSEILWWENNLGGPGPEWIMHPVDLAFGGTWSVHSDDIDGDGDVDVLGAAYGADDIAWWENVDGTGITWIEHPICETYDGAQSVNSDDVDGDGDIDVLGAAQLADDITWWENADGLGIFWIEHTIDGDFDGAYSVYSDDINGDGDIDVLGAAHNADDITWWENVDGLGTTWIESTIDGSFDCAYFVRSNDIDGDGAVDVLGAAQFANDVTWWDLNAYISNASLESSILNTGCDPDWGTLLWSSQTPPGTAVSFQVRASDDYSQMGSWSDTLAAPCLLHGILSDNASCIQYRAILETADPDTTPKLLDVTVTWDPLGTGEGGGPTTLELLPFSPNPSSGPVVVSFGLPSDTETSFSVFDVSGRVVAQKSAAEYPAGYQQIQLGELPPGIYICRMRAGSFTATQRFAVVE